MKASFDVEQPSVKILEDGDKIYIFIAVNGTWVDHKYDEAEMTKRVWECDYREIVTEKGNIDINKVKANPEKYLEWTEEKEKTAFEKIAELQEQNKMLTQCLMEMSEIVYA